MDTNQTSEKLKLKRRLKTGCLLVVTLFLIVVFIAVGRFLYITRDVEVYDEDLIVEFKNVPDEVNGYFSLRRARQAVEEDLSDADVLCLTVTNKIPSEENLNAYRVFAREHPDVLVEFYSVAGYEHCQIPLEDGVPLFVQKTMPLSGLIVLGNLSLCHIDNLIRKGDHAEALNCLESHLKIGHMINSGGHNLITGAMGFDLNRMGKGLLTAHLSRGTFSDAEYVRIREIVVGLSEYDEWEHMIRAEYCSSKSAVLLVSDDFDAAFERTLKFERYIYNESIVLSRLAKYFHETLQSIENPNVQPDKGFLLASDDISGATAFQLYWSGELVNQMVCQIVMPSFESIIRRVSYERSRDDLINLYMGLWLCHIDHGALPDRLEELVPGYVSELPHDIYAEDGSFGYDPQKKIIFSGGSDDEKLSISLSFVD